MKRRGRALSIFSLSALDVLAMSTGVFVLLLVMLMPYYRKTLDANADIAAARAATAVTSAEQTRLEQIAVREHAKAQALESEAAKLNAEAAALEATLRRGPSPAPAKAGRDTGQQVVEALDLVFVVDTTSSMTPVLRELAASMASIVRMLERLVPSVRIGIAAYKDRDTGLPPVEVFPLASTATDLARILDFAERLDASPIGSRTIEEDMHLGLQAAMLMAFRPEARQELVVIGDAAAHPEVQDETLYRLREFVRAHANRSVSALFVTTPSSLSRGNRARPYFEAVALAGGGSFNDHAGSMIESVLLSVLTE